MSPRRSIAAIAAMLAFAAASFVSSALAEAHTIPSTASPDAATSRPQPVETAGLAAPHSDDQRAGSGSTALAAATACVTGQASYRDQNNNTRPSHNLTVQVWDRDDTSPDDLLAFGVTASNGLYKLCFDNDDAYRGQDVYVKLIAENTRWRVQDNSGDRYLVQFDGPNNLADGSTFNFGTRMPPTSKMRAWHAFDEANDAWKFVPHDASSCWATSTAETACQQLFIEWTAGVVISTPHYNGMVRLSADTPDYRDAVVHEIGHFVMHKAYGTDNYNSIEDCPDAGHAPDHITNTGCAWAEGFADWFALAVYNDPVFHGPDGTTADFEAATYGTATNGNAWSLGDAVEGRVAGALYDLADWSDEQPYDRFAEGAGPIWTTLMNNVSHSFKEFWQQHGLSSSQALASVYQNTIDYGFRDPLADYGELTRDFSTLGSPLPHNYRYASNVNYWSVAAVRPQSGVNVDLALYDDANLTTKLATSNSDDSRLDFVAVDSNYRAVGDAYYPQTNLVKTVGSASGYGIELAQGANQLQSGFQPVTMQPTDVVAVRDVYLTAGTPTRITVTPANPNQDAAVFLMGDDPADPATWVRGRGSAVASANATDAGEAESMTYNPPRTGWYGFVLLNAPDTGLDGGGGTYTVLREDLAPSGAALAPGAAAPADPQKPSSTDEPER